MDGNREGQRAAATLGVGPLATKDEIRRAFRARAKQLHPDTMGSDEAFIALRAAFELLHPAAPDRSAVPPQAVTPKGVPPQAVPRPPAARWMTTTRPMPRPPVVGAESRRATANRSRPSGAAAGRDRTGRRVAEPVRDARGLTFEDHLMAVLAEPPTLRGVW